MNFSIIADNALEENETFVLAVNMSDPSILLNIFTVTISIIDDDGEKNYCYMFLNTLSFI